ncbi:MAG TPA: HAMP domain-containing sensor histidine kinase, partial [Cyclobacteriaceae bacterium]|nr:HAMP domain-containing sensor histidine kinase [Cyclobacteriaceae bacterium]
FLIACMVIPLLVIHVKEKELLITTLLMSALPLIFLDFIFNAFGVGYYSLGGTESQYYFKANFYCITSYAFILLSLIFERNLIDRAVQENERLVSFLQEANQKLEFQKDKISAQNIEITKQTQELIGNQEHLIKANDMIEKQKESLLKIQSGLQTELLARNKELTHTNEELAKYNHELQQFSFTISHNLRGPLARLLGLTNLMEKDLNELTGSQLELVRLVMQSAKELDEVIKDLNKIIDIRNDIYRIREKVYFQEELNMVLRSLSTFIQPDVKIDADFREAPIVYTIRPILTSVLYNLISNAIKYRSPQRSLQLKITTTQVNNSIKLQVSDNGLGMNLNQFSRSIFGMYKRFHTHTDGKGLGLYLVKLQIESLGGKVEVASELNVGTTFNVSFPDNQEVEGQIVFESDFGSIFYNARTNCAGIVWKKQVTSEQYRTLFAKCLEMVRLYHTPYWISDLSKQGTISPDDQKWMVTTIMPEAIQQGLRKIANVYFEGQTNEDYRKRINEAAAKLGVEIELFTDRKKAEDWIDDSTTLNSKIQKHADTD